MPSYQPFLISEFNTGLYSYLQPWIRPLDAFEPLTNAFIYRGVLNKREGRVQFGQMAYTDILANGNGGKTYSGTLVIKPINAGSFNPTNGTESFHDNGDGTLTGSPGGSGTINYTTGAWSLTFNANVSAGTLISWSYSPYTAYTLAAMPIGQRPIMGLKQWTNEATDTTSLIAFDTRRASEYNNSTNVFVPLNLVSQSFRITGNGSKPYTINTGWVAVSPYTTGIAPGSMSITDSPNSGTITDTDGDGTFTVAGRFDATTTFNYSTGVLTLHYNGTAGTIYTITITATLTGDYFSGNQSNFFNTTNWLGILYATNNVDPITTFDGTNLGRPPFATSLAHYNGVDTAGNPNDIATCLDVKIYKNRFLVLRPTYVTTPSPNVSNQDIAFSAVNAPTNLAADVAGNGGEVAAPTDDIIQSSEFLRDQLLVFFTNSVFSFRFTNSSFAPFVWDKLNATKSTSAPYGTIAYDQRVTSMGKKGLLACDGVNVQRYDLQIIDEFDQINQIQFAQCYGFRFDVTNQSWMLFPSRQATASPAGPILSDSALIYNFLENSWAIYEFPLNSGLSCMGSYFETVDATWNQFAPGAYWFVRGFTQWVDDPVTGTGGCNFPWNDFELAKDAPILLGGGIDGNIYQMETGDTDAAGVPVIEDTIEAIVTSTQWNPFTKVGQKVQFGYIDFYYEIVQGCVLNISFQIDNSSDPITRQLTTDGPTDEGKNMKRIYINATGEFLRMTIESVSEAPFQIYGLVLWARPAGRLTP